MFAVANPQIGLWQSGQVTTSEHAACLMHNMRCALKPCTVPSQGGNDGDWTCCLLQLDWWFERGLCSARACITKKPEFLPLRVTMLNPLRQLLATTCVSAQGSQL